MPLLSIQDSMVFLGVFGPAFGMMAAFCDHLAKSRFQADASGGFLPSRKALKIYGKVEGSLSIVRLICFCFTFFWASLGSII
jgi:hypothetical protein